MSRDGATGATGATGNWIEPLTVERNRHEGGWWLLFVAISTLVVTLAWTWFAPLPPTVAMPLVVLSIAAAAWAVRLTRDHGHHLEIDLTSRTVVPVRRGERLMPRPLASLGPLEVMQRSGPLPRRVLSHGPYKFGKGIDYLVVAHGAGGGPGAGELFLLRACRSAYQARRVADELARAWNLPVKSFGGELRQPEEVGQPLHQRRRGQAGPPLVVEPEWQVRLERDPGGARYRIRSLRREPRHLWMATAGLMCFALTAMQGFESFEALERGRSMFSALWPLLFAAGYLVLGIVIIRKAVDDSFHPGTLTIEAGGVHHRRGRLRLEEIEEVAAPGPIQLLGSESSLLLPVSFCPPEAVAPLAREIERCIVELATGRGRNRPAPSKRPSSSRPRSARRTEVVGGSCTLRPRPARPLRG